ncbi:MAG TPA: HEPN domain-containing protein [Bacillota bacterium]|nr:HEPN domain-containing protein [Bacillota bacterium]
MNRYRDWLEQAGYNLRYAEHGANAGYHAWACFAAHQAGEAALKGLHLRLGQVAWGHSLLDLLSSLPESVRPAASLLDNARILDKYYIPTRYPDAHPAGPASRHYSSDEAIQAICLAREVLDFCEGESVEA